MTLTLCLPLDVLIVAWKGLSTQRRSARTQGAIVVREGIRTIVEEGMGVAEEATRTTATTIREEETTGATRNQTSVQVVVGWGAVDVLPMAAKIVTSKAANGSNRNRTNRSNKSGQGDVRSRQSSSHNLPSLTPPPPKLLQN